MFTADWVVDDNTGKKYLVIDTTTFAHDVNQDKCLQHGGILPEPRSQEENQFLHDLNSDTFVLGMSDRQTEDSWVWDSDGTPVVYQTWFHGQPKDGSGENCAIMMRNYASGGTLWDDVPCLSNEYLDTYDKNLICQKPEGMFLFSFFFFLL